MRRPQARRSLAHRKRRTRQHIIADLSVNHIERFVLLRGHSVELVRRDYGLDMLIFFHDRRGYLLDGHVSVQVKATDRPRYVVGKTQIAMEIDRRDLNAWLRRLEPVILVIYDARLGRAHWCYVQAEVDTETAAEHPSRNLHGRVTIRVSTSQRVNEHGVDQFATYNTQLIERLLKVVRYEA